MGAWECEKLRIRRRAFRKNRGEMLDITMVLHDPLFAQDALSCDAGGGGANATLQADAIFICLH